MQVFHPGKVLLEDFIMPNGWTQAQVAKDLQWTPARISALINGKRGITAESALDLAALFYTTPKLWMMLQANFDLKRAEEKRIRVDKTYSG